MWLASWENNVDRCNMGCHVDFLFRPGGGVIDERKGLREVAHSIQLATDANMTRWAFTVDLERCVGCQSCVIACKAENGTPPGIHWMKVLEKEVGEFPYAKRTFTPVRCNHCEDPPCAKACPTGAIRKRPDGIVIVDQDLCIGTMACMSACPYYVPYRWDGDDGYFGEELNGYEREKYSKFKPGTAQKCHFCYHRIDEGRPPACVEACPADALNYGDRDDPESRVNVLLRRKKHFRPREELGSKPSLYYLTGKGGGPVRGGGES